MDSIVLVIIFTWLFVVLPVTMATFVYVERCLNRWKEGHPAINNKRRNKRK